MQEERRHEKDDKRERNNQEPEGTGATKGAVYRPGVSTPAVHMRAVYTRSVYKRVLYGRAVHKRAGPFGRGAPVQCWGSSGAGGWVPPHVPPL